MFSVYRKEKNTREIQSWSDTRLVQDALKHQHIFFFFLLYYPRGLFDDENHNVRNMERHDQKKGGLEEHCKEGSFENVLKIYCVLLWGANVNKHCFPCEYYYVRVMVNIKNQIF